MHTCSYMYIFHKLLSAIQLFVVYSAGNHWFIVNCLQFPLGQLNLNATHIIYAKMVYKIIPMVLQGVLCCARPNRGKPVQCTCTCNRSCGKVPQVGKIDFVIWTSMVTTVNLLYFAIITQRRLPSMWPASTKTLYQHLDGHVVNWQIIQKNIWLYSKTSEL